MTRTPSARSRRTVLGALGAAALTAAALPLAAPASAATPLDFERQVLTTGVTDPTKVDVAPDGDVYIAERTGGIKVWRQDGTLTQAGKLTVSETGGFATFSASNPELEEGGLHGLLLGEGATAGKLFTYYSVKGSYDPATKNGIFRLSSWDLTADDKLVAGSEKTLLDVPTEWERCCHYGGAMSFDEDGAILLAVGDDTSPRDEGWAPRDNRPGREAFNAERTSQNPKSLSGKVLRIATDGSVPEDNPFADDPRYDPYVYSLGWRSNYSMSYDAATGLAFVGNVGPDANNADSARGPQGYDELGVVRPGGGDNHGWPRCIADNKPYMDYDYASGTSEGPLACKDDITGEPFTADRVFYRNVSRDFPEMGAGFGATIMVGPLYRKHPGKLALPAAFHDKLIFGDWSRSLLYTVDLAADRKGIDPSTITPFSVGQPSTFVSVVPTQVGTVLPTGPANPISFDVGPDGAVYVAEYGSGYYNNTDSKISRMVCRGCKASPEDYAGAPAVKDFSSLAAPAAAGTGSSTATKAGVAAVGALVPLALVGLVRRRRVA